MADDAKAAGLLKLQAGFVVSERSRLQRPEAVLLGRGDDRFQQLTPDARHPDYGILRGQSGFQEALLPWSGRGQRRLNDCIHLRADCTECVAARNRDAGSVTCNGLFRRLGTARRLPKPSPTR